VKLSGQYVAPVGRKPIFRPLSENNTGMAALCASFPVITDNLTKCNNIPVYCQQMTSQSYQHIVPSENYLSMNWSVSKKSVQWNIELKIVENASITFS